MSLTHDPTHNGISPFAIKSDESSATSYWSEPNATARLARPDAGSFVSTLLYIFGVHARGQETPQNDYVVLLQETPGLTRDMGT